MEAFLAGKGIISASAGLFNVFENGDHCTEPHVYNRRDFYKISLLLAKSRLRWGQQEVAIDRPALVFYNPHTPFAWDPVSAEQPGYFCLFKKEFLGERSRSESLQNSPLFRAGSNPVFFPGKQQLKPITGIFREMLACIESGYVYKYDLLRNYLQLMIHQVMMMQPEALASRQRNASERIASLFLELLERQFPIDAPERPLELRTAGDYAKALSVHVNHLNHAVREVTGKPTSVHIADRVLAEAKALLKHTDWPVSDIAYSLGFEYPSYFNNFFKKKTGHPPGVIRA